jgi:RNA polymerase sigma-70 factor (ECF subfamily)
MIQKPATPHQEAMDSPELALPRTASIDSTLSARERDARITAIVRSEHDFIWRLLRRLGVPAANVDDATQLVFVVAARRIADIVPGSERSFLFGAALRIASDQRRAAQTRQQTFSRIVDEADPLPDPEALAARREQRRVLDEILDTLPMDLRSVLVLFEFEQMSKAEVSALLEIPVGTAVSRLRRAREEFKAAAKRRLYREGSARGKP